MNASLSQLDNLITDLELADVYSEELFYKLLGDSIEILNLTHEDVMHMFDMSFDSLMRWKLRKNAPHPLIRKLVYRTFLELAGARKLIHFSNLGI